MTSLRRLLSEHCIAETPDQIDALADERKYFPAPMLPVHVMSSTEVLTKEDMVYDTKYQRARHRNGFMFRGVGLMYHAGAFWRIIRALDAENRKLREQLK